MSSDPIVKYIGRHFGDEQEFKIGDIVELEDYPPNKEPDWNYPGCWHCVIVEVWDYDGDADDYGQPITIPAGAYVAVVLKGKDAPIIEKVTIDQLFKEGEIYDEHGYIG